MGLFMIPLSYYLIIFESKHDLTQINKYHWIYSLFTIHDPHMKKNLQKIKEDYEEYYRLAHTNSLKGKSSADVQASKLRAQKLVMDIQEKGEFQYLEEADFYKDKLTELEAAFKEAKEKKMKVSEFTPIAQGILQEKTFVSRNSYLKKQKKQPSMEAPEIQNKLISSFFQEKKSKIVPEVGFKSLLENPPVTSKLFKKKPQSTNEELEKLRSENYELRKQLSQQGNQEISQDDLERLRNQQEKIRQLEEQNYSLQRDNEKLKSQKSMTYVEVPRPRQPQEEFNPYTMRMRQNDLYKINVRNESESGITNRRSDFESLVDQSPSFNEGMNNYVSRNHETYSNMSDMDNENYSVFDMTKSYYTQSGADRNSYKVGIENSRTAGKNKAAFFKSSGILLRDEQFEIAYKRSDPDQDENYSRVRVIFYFNNKTGRKKYFSAKYDFEEDYYSLDVKERAEEVGAFKQTREVIQLRLKSRVNDLNSIVEAQISVDGKVYRFWVPAIFIKFSKKTDNRSNSHLDLKTVYPHKCFSNSYEAKKIMVDAVESRGNLSMWGVSRFEEGEVNLHWKRDGKLEVKAPGKWVDFLAFVLYDFK